MEKLIKRFYAYGFFLIFPLTAPITPEFETVFGLVNADMLWLFAISFLFFLLALKRLRKQRLSKFTLALGCYYCYYLGNAILQGYSDLIVKTDISLMVTGILAIELIDQMKFEVEDRINLLRPLSILIIVTFIGTLLQVFVDQSLFFPAKEYNELSEIDFEGFWRYSSIFDAMIQNQGGIAFIFLGAIFLSLNKEKYHPSYVVLLSLLFVIVYFTYARYIMLSIMVFVIYFAYFKIRGVRLRTYTPLLIGIVIVSFFMVFSLYKDMILQSDYFQVRVSGDISGRTVDPLIFLSEDLWKHLVFGAGFSSFHMEYYYGTYRRLHSGFWDILFQGGVVGLLLFLLVLYQLHQRAKLVFKKTGNEVFLLFAPIILIINFTAILNLFFFWGYILMFYYMSLEDQIAGQKNALESRVRVHKDIGSA